MCVSTWRTARQEAKRLPEMRIVPGSDAEDEGERGGDCGQHDGQEEAFQEQIEQVRREPIGDHVAQMKSMTGLSSVRSAKV